MPNISYENPVNDLTLQSPTLNIPEANSNIPQDEMPNQLHEVAPGEGKTPINLVFCQDWDAKAFPMLHPDGKNHLFDKRRKRKL